MDGFVKVALQMMVNEIGKDTTEQILSDFSCPLNKDIESFLKRKALVFEEQRLSATHLVFASYKSKPVLVGYYTLALKSFNITKNALSSRLKRRVNKFATYDHASKQYLLSAPLIAQLGKNFTNGYNKLITGDELLKIACDDVAILHQLAGGKIVYLECEDNIRLIDFYTENGFVQFGKRELDKDETEINGTYLVQMLKYC